MGFIAQQQVPSLQYREFVICISHRPYSSIQLLSVYLSVFISFLTVSLSLYPGGVIPAGAVLD